jgi:uncharacterized DUF497 family protein
MGAGYAAMYLSRETAGCNFRPTVEEDDNLIRILSARKATPQERRIYAQGY